MCDTLGKIGPAGRFFAKNSDRSPNEIQIPEYHPAKEGLSGTVQCTYISLPQAEHTYGALLSRPSWMWGAEMGVNEWGLCIGNEAVFTKGAYGKTGLTGMDMVRLALERCKTVREALALLIELLETFGQGGNCGFDHDFYYDNAFLLMDRTEICILETAGKNWAYRFCDSGSISNRLSLGPEADACSGGKVYDFKGKHLEPVYSTFSGSAHRQQQTNRCLEQLDSVGACMTALSQHRETVKTPFASGSVSSVCMHYGALVGDHTTGSMVVALEDRRTVVWSTGSSCPCVSLFKPWLFGAEPTAPVAAPGNAGAYWLEAERFRRMLLGKKLPEEFYRQRAEIQSRWNLQASATGAEDFPAFSLGCLEEETAFFAFWKNQALEDCRCSPGFRSRWSKKNRILFPDGKDHL